MTDQEIQKILKMQYEEAMQGRKKDFEINLSYHICENAVKIVVLIDNEHYLKEFREWLIPFCKRKEFQNAVILSEQFREGEENINEIRIIYLERNRQEIDRILKYYILCKSQNVYVISFDQPFGNDNMLGHKGIEFKDWLRGLDL